MKFFHEMDAECHSVVGTIVGTHRGAVSRKHRQYPSFRLTYNELIEQFWGDKI